MQKFIRTFAFIMIVLTMFYSNPSPASGPPCACGHHRLLKLQSPILEGQDVRDIQMQLKKLGYFDKVIHGKYDKHTADAVRDFQRSEGLKVDGVFGPKSLERLAQAYLRESEDGLLPSGGVRDHAWVSEGEISLAVDALNRTLTVLVEGRPYKTFPVALGKFDTPTPIGLFTITQKDAWGEGFGSRWMQISVPWGVFGIHGTNKPWSIGGFESHGCIRMHNSHVEQVYEWVGIGTRVFIFGGIDGPFTFGLNTLTEGSKGGSSEAPDRFWVLRRRNQWHLRPSGAQCSHRFSKGKGIRPFGKCW